MPKTPSPIPVPVEQASELCRQHLSEQAKWADNHITYAVACLLAAVEDLQQRVTALETPGKKK